MFAIAASLLSLAVASRAATHNVTVGGAAGLRYDPQFISADPGDVVLFTFMPKNHTVTTSSFANPCTNAGSFDSGFMPVAENATGSFPTAQFTVKDTNPVWMYCRQAGHCAAGMVFAINPQSADQFNQFQAAANATASNATSTTTSVSTPPVVTVTATVTVSNGNLLTTTYGSYPGSTEPTAAAAANHVIQVGGTNKLIYDPANITAQPGDTVTFVFNVKNHTATQSSFSNPCRPLADTSSTGQVGFDSGFMPVAADATTFPNFTVTVNDTAPVWVYCRQTGHCGQGMVFSVNAIESGPNNFAAFQALAEKLNGTSSTSSSAASPTNSGSSSGAMSLFRGRLAAIAVSSMSVVIAAFLF